MLAGAFGVLGEGGSVARCALRARSVRDRADHHLLEAVSGLLVEWLIEVPVDVQFPKVTVPADGSTQSPWSILASSCRNHRLASTR